MTAIESASKHSTMKISRSYVNLRVIQVFFSSLHILFKALSNVCTYNVFSSIHSSAKARREQNESFEKIHSNILTGIPNFFFNGYEFHFNSTSSLSLFIFKSTFNCKFAIIELVGDDDDHHPYGDECFFLHTFLSITRYDVESFHSKLL